MTSSTKIEWVINGNKRCCTCKQYKPFSSYHKDKNAPAGLAYSCKPCAIDRSRFHHRRRMKEEPEYRAAKRNSYIKNTHGITAEQYEQRLADQNYLCAICATAAPKGGWHLDHNHVTGKYRAMLCGVCNRGLGYFQDDAAVLQKAIEYLETHNDDE